MNLYTPTKKIAVERGLRQGDTVSITFFTAVLEYVFKRPELEHKIIIIYSEYLNNLRFAYDEVLISENLNDANEMLKEHVQDSKSVDLEVNYSKTKIMNQRVLQDH